MATNPHRPTILWDGERRVFPGEAPFHALSGLKSNAPHQHHHAASILMALSATAPRFTSHATNGKHCKVAIKRDIGILITTPTKGSSFLKL